MKLTAQITISYSPLVESAEQIFLHNDYRRHSHYYHLQQLIIFAATAIPSTMSHGTYSDIISSYALLNGTIHSKEHAVRPQGYVD